MLDGQSIADVIDLDVARGTVRVAAGISFDALMRFVIPRGFFVPVTPGTRLVTVGGALAADVHGKNHHVDGSIANHVESFVLHTPKGVVTVTPESDPELFWGTAGAMGLTGVVTEVVLAVAPGGDLVVAHPQRALPRPRHRDGTHARRRRRLPLLRGVDRLRREWRVARSVDPVPWRPRVTRGAPAEAAF